MIRMYSRKLLLPFVGVIQIAELGKVRALSLDGENWAIHFDLSKGADQPAGDGNVDPDSQFALVATIQEGQLKTKAAHAYLDPAEDHSVIEQLYTAVTSASIPLTAADCYEFWLLDDTDGKPLALLRSAIDADDIARSPQHPVWLAMPAAQLQIPTEEAAQDVYVPPVNYRLERLIEERAGPKPRAVWFNRADPVTAQDFPPCLIREDWQDAQHQYLCDLYIQRLAPRLLMLEGLPTPVRQRLECAARSHVFDIERFYRLYPAVVDASLLNSARVEAQLRRSNPS